MITVSNILLQGARGLDNANPQNGDAEITVPNTLLGTVPLRFPLDITTVTDPTIPMTTSFSAAGAALVIGGGGAVSTLIATLSKGLWEINAIGSFSSNYDDVNGTFEHRLQLAAPSTVQIIGFKAGGIAAAPVVQSVQRTMLILIPIQSTITVVGNNNAAGQRANSYFNIICSRLL